MMAIVGVIVLCVMVFGGFAITGGALGPVFHALPHEMLIIGGAALGMLIISNDIGSLKKLAGGVGRIVKGPKFKREDFLSAIFLSVRLMRLLKAEGAVAVEPHVEEPQSSSIWKDYPRLLNDEFLVSLTCDTIRLLVVSTGNISSVAIEDVLDTAIDTRHDAEMRPVEQLSILGDALPALGIVAAVLGVVKTMGSIDQPPPVLGGMIGSALVGTFLGVLLAYGFVNPMAGRLRAIVESDAEIYHVIRKVILSSLRNQPQPIILETARTAIGPVHQPEFTEVFEGLRGKS